MPRNLGQITERLPAANYQRESSLNRQQSLPAMRSSDLNRANNVQMPVSVKKGRAGSLATIKERDEQIRSADPRNMSNSR